MAMNVKIISVETVKPSSPTPDEKRIYKRSLLDQIILPSYMSFVLFYSKPETSMSESELNDHLKASLSETLTHFYPLAGRIKDEFRVDCNDYGVSYVQAHVDVNLSEILEHPNLDVIGQLVPSCPNEMSNGICEKPFSAFQFNKFACGGVALVVKFLHVLADASSIGSFLKLWAAIARGDASNMKDKGAKVVDSASLFPPREGALRTLDDLFANVDKPSLTTKTNTIVKRMLFEAPKIAALKEKIGNEPSFTERPISRVEALYALIWGAMIRIAKEENDQSNSNGELDYHLAMSVVNLRNRLNPPLPTDCMGNIFLDCVAKWPLNETINYNLLAGKISQSLKIINGDFLNKNRYRLLDYLFDTLRHIFKGPHQMFRLNSLCNFPFRESDFGFGKPIWYAPCTKVDSSVLLFDAPHGKGIEAWMALPEEYMVKFERDPTILEYAKFDC